MFAYGPEPLVIAGAKDRKKVVFGTADSANPVFAVIRLQNRANVADGPQSLAVTRPYRSDMRINISEFENSGCCVFRVPWR